MKDVNTFLSEMRSSSSEEVAAMWARCEEFYNKKLWHQLTMQLNILVKEPSMQTKLISIYTDFIADFETKLDPLMLSQIGMVVVEKYTVPEEAIAFVERIQDKVKMHNEALCLCKVMVGRVRLNKLQQQKETKIIIEEVENL
jgi:26S proteasome regulatory subunit N9